MAGFFIGDVVFAAEVGFLAGAFGASAGWGLMASGALAFAALALIFRSLRIFASWPLAALVFCALALGALYYHWRVDARAAEIFLPFGKPVSFSAIVSDEPRASAKFLILPAEVERPVAEDGRAWSVGGAGSIAIFVPPGSAFHYGDELRIAGRVEAPRKAGESPAVFPKSVALAAEHRGFWLREKLIGFKSAILEKFNEVLPGDAAALLGGETLGGTSGAGGTLGMSAELKKEMSASGTSYVVAMYGYKIAVAVFALEALLGGWLPRRARFFLALCLAVLFIAMSGGNPSAARGGAMVLLALTAALAGRVFDPRNALAATAVVMALSDPTILAQAAFQLSFLSIIGILYLARPIENFFRWDRDRRDRASLVFFFRAAAVFAVASLLPIIPVIVNAFGDFSLTAFLSNTLIFPAVLPAMVLGFALAVAGFVSYYLAFVVAHLAEIVLWYQLWIIKIFSRFVVPLPFAFDSAMVFVLYYAALVLFAYRYGDQSYGNR